jgi:COP9 signalosome complex subunit 6
MEGKVEEARQSASGLDFKLHPLVLINVSDHYTRSKANDIDCSGGQFRVLGCLLGQQVGRNVDISNSFEILYAAVEGKVVMDDAFMAKRLDQYKQVYPALDVVGWYATGAQQEADMETHKQIMALNESPVLLLLDPTLQSGQRDLPVRLFESELHVKEGVASFSFVQANFHIETSEAERIGVNQVAKILPSGKSSGSDQLTAHYQSMHAAVKMLISRIQALHQLVSQMQSGALPYDHQLARQAAALVRRLPVLDTPQFHEDYLTEYNDTMLTVYMSSVTKGLSATHDVIEKFNIAYDRTNPRRRGGL